MEKPTLKIGFVLDSDRPNAWVIRILEEIEKAHYAHTSVLLLIDKAELDSQESTAERLFYRLYSSLEERRLSGHGKQLAKLLQPSSLPDELSVLDCDPLTPDQAFKQQVREYELDVIINLSQVDLDPAYRGLARLGVWQLCYGQDLQGFRNHPDGFWENYHRSPVMDCMLVRQTSASSTTDILYHVTFATEENRSALFNRIQAYIYSAEIIPRKLRELHEQGETLFHDSLDSLPILPKENVHAASLPRPSNVQMLRFLLERFRSSLGTRFLSKTCHLQWTLRYRIGQGISTNFEDYKELIPTRDGWWADPFLVFDKGQYHLFFEDALLDKNNANISVISIAEDGTMSDPQPCLVRPYHLSYPFVFEWEGEYYMIPESKGNRTIEMYRAKQFPHEWEFHMNLMEDVEAVDTTLFFHEDKWWLFTNLRAQRGLSIDNELSIFYADSPLSTNWTPHPKNPVITDVRRARPAGRIYEFEGKTIRPSQDGSVRYGYGMRLNEITLLTETDYQEREVEYIEPNWGKRLRGTHTIAHANDMTVIDVLEWRPRATQRV